MIPYWLWSLILRYVLWFQDREDRLLGERLVDALGDVGDGVSRRRIRYQWRKQWRQKTMRAKWGHR